MEVSPGLYIMLESTYRYGLLRSRLRGFTRTLLRVKSIDTRGASRAWVAARRLREVLPVLHLPGPSVEKLNAKLRRLQRRLEDVRETDASLNLLDQALDGERRGKLAAARVRVSLEEAGKRARTDFFKKKVGHDIRRVAAKLNDQLALLGADGDTRTELRDLQWDVRARVARRAADLKMAIQAAGSVYLPKRLEAVHVELRKLFFGAELASEVTPGVSAAEVRTLVRVQTLLGQLGDVQTLIDSVRQVQSTLATPDLKAWRDLDGLVITLENRCRALHAQYVRERTALVALCDHLVAGAPAAATTKRKVG
jgi:CHAD domain-containing protein